MAAGVLVGTAVLFAPIAASAGTDDIIVPSLLSPAAVAVAKPAETDALAGPESVAQTVPSDPGSSRSTPVAPRGTARNKRFSANLTLSKSYALGADQLSLPGQNTSNQIFLDGNLQYQVAPRYRLYFKKADKNSTGGRQYSAKGVPTYGGFSNDVQDTVGFSYAAGRNEQYDVFYTYRYRTCCPGAADPKNLSQRHFHGIGVGYTNRFGHESKIGKPFTIYLEETRVKHMFDVVGASSVGDIGPQWILTSGYFNAQFRVWGQQKLIPYYQYEHFDTFMDNNLTGTHSNRTRIGFRMPGNKLASYNFYVRNTQPYNPTVNTTHDVMLVLETTLKLNF